MAFHTSNIIVVVAGLIAAVMLVLVLNPPQALFHKDDDCSPEISMAKETMERAFGSKNNVIVSVKADCGERLLEMVRALCSKKGGRLSMDSRPIMCKLPLGRLEE